MKTSTILFIIGGVIAVGTIVYLATRKNDDRDDGPADLSADDKFDRNIVFHVTE